MASATAPLSDQQPIPPSSPSLQTSTLSSSDSSLLSQFSKMILLQQQQQQQQQLQTPADGALLPSPVLYTSNAKQTSSSSPSANRKLLLSALRKANEAVVLDNDLKAHEARIAYIEACKLLKLVVEQSHKTSERERLRSIFDVYALRIGELEITCSTSQQDSPPTPSPDDNDTLTSTTTTTTTTVTPARPSSTHSPSIFYDPSDKASLASDADADPAADDDDDDADEKLLYPLDFPQRKNPQVLFNYLDNRAREIADETAAAPGKDRQQQLPHEVIMTEFDLELEIAKARFCHPPVAAAGVTGAATADSSTADGSKTSLETRSKSSTDDSPILDYNSDDNGDEFAGSEITSAATSKTSSPCKINESLLDSPKYAVPSTQNESAWRHRDLPPLPAPGSTEASYKLESLTKFSTPSQEFQDRYSTSFTSTPQQQDTHRYRRSGGAGAAGGSSSSYRMSLPPQSPRHRQSSSPPPPAGGRSLQNSSLLATPRREAKLPLRVMRTAAVPPQSATSGSGVNASPSTTSSAASVASDGEVRRSLLDDISRMTFGGDASVSLSSGRASCDDASSISSGSAKGLLLASDAGATTTMTTVLEPPPATFGVLQRQFWQMEKILDALTSPVGGMIVANRPLRLSPELFLTSETSSLPAMADKIVCCQLVIVEMLKFESEPSLARLTKVERVIDMIEAHLNGRLKSSSSSSAGSASAGSAAGQRLSTTSSTSSSSSSAAGSAGAAAAAAKRRESTGSSFSTGDLYSNRARSSYGREFGGIAEAGSSRPELAMLSAGTPSSSSGSSSSSSGVPVPATPTSSITTTPPRKKSGSSSGSSSGWRSLLKSRGSSSSSSSSSATSMQSSSYRQPQPQGAPNQISMPNGMVNVMDREMSRVSTKIRDDVLNGPFSKYVQVLAIMFEHGLALREARRQVSAREGSIGGRRAEMVVAHIAEVFERAVCGFVISDVRALEERSQSGERV